MTAKMKMMINKTKVKLDKAPMVLDKMVKMSLRDFHDLANLNTLNNLKDLNIERPETPSANSSTKDRATIKKSKQFQESCEHKNTFY